MQSLGIKVDRVTYANPATGFVVIRGLEGTKADVTAVDILPDVMSNIDTARRLTLMGV